MIMRHNHTSRPVFERPSKYLARMYERRCKRSDRYYSSCYEAVSAVRGQTENIFLLFGTDKLKVRQNVKLPFLATLVLNF